MIDIHKIIKIIKKINQKYLIILVITVSLILLAFAISPNKKQKVNINKLPTAKTNTVNSTTAQVVGQKALNDSKNDDGTTTRTIQENIVLPYSVNTTYKSNMAPGTTALVKGINGSRLDTYSITDDSQGNVLSKKLIRSQVVAEPVVEEDVVGTAQFNLNKDILNSTSAGVACLLSYYNTNPDCMTAPVFYSFSQIEISNINYIYCLSDSESLCPSDTKNKNLNGIMKVDNNIFVYNNQQFRTDARKGGGVNTLLTQQDCNDFGLACASW